MSNEKDRVYLNIPEAFVKENLTNKQTGQSFNLATMPKNTFIDGKDVGGYQFSPLYVNKPLKFSGNQMVLDENNKPVINEDSKMRVIPMKADSEIWLKDNKTKDKVITTPEALKDALSENRKMYLAEQKEKNQNVDEQTLEEAQNELISGSDDIEIPFDEPKPIRQESHSVRADKPKIMSPNELIANATERAMKANADKGGPNPNPTIPAGKMKI